MQSAYDVGLIIRDEDSGGHRLRLSGNPGRRYRHELQPPLLCADMRFADK
jgi:hypothetical protein